MVVDDLAPIFLLLLCIDRTRADYPLCPIRRKPLSAQNGQSEMFNGVLIYLMCQCGLVSEKSEARRKKRGKEFIKAISFPI